MGRLEDVLGARLKHVKYLHLQQQVILHFAFQLHVQHLQLPLSHHLMDQVHFLLALAL
jgi:hypothetical protein